jgi:hypothetical protein
MTAAAMEAAAAGMPLNRFITLHLSEIGYDGHGARLALANVLRALAEHMRRAGHRFAHVWSRERGDAKGDHAHILAHVPRAAAKGFNACLRRAVNRLAGGRAPRGTLLTRAIGASVDCYASNPALWRVNLEAALAYAMKGMDGSQGEIIGKRCGWSQNIGAMARARSR